MKRDQSVIFTILFIAATLLFATSSFAAYSYSLDQFQLTGPITFSDHFNDNNLDPGFWDVDDPTVTESGTNITFTNPGTADGFTLGSFNISSEMSYISTNFHSSNNSGNFQAVSTWNATSPALNQMYLMNLSTGSGDEDILMGFANWGTEMASFFGVPTGPAIFFGRVDDVGAGDFDLYAISIDPAAITGSVLLSISFDDTLDLFYGAYSIDGTNLITPSEFNAVASESGGFISGDWSLGTESFSVQPVPAPSAFILLLFGVPLIFLYRRK